ncbi:MAG TPA: hypothetical protein VHM24_03055 [Gemmatimonadaceae bacterium]|nr:hypothetical protein [Gemmatimonadaceae bacterium]
MRFRFVALAMITTLTASARSAAQTGSVTAKPVDTSYVNYDEAPLSLPLGIGFRIPAYNRVDGLVLPWGPTLMLGAERLKMDATVAYRSHLGAFDPRLETKIQLSKLDEVAIDIGRETFSNDRWIRTDIINSLTALGVGSDSRNYFRADRGTAEITHRIVTGSTTWKPYVGVLYEDAWSTGVATWHTNAPWSFFGRTDSLKMRRPNPAILEGHTTSGLAGVGVEYEEADVKANMSMRIEHAFDSPTLVASDDGGQFTQATLGSKASFPTFGTQHFDFRAHAVLGFGDAAPPQRFAYLGGAGTLATVDLLALGGNRLLYVEGEYSVPLPRPALPFVGAPVVSLRYAAGAAGVGELPDLIQNISVGVGVKLLKAEYHIDPNYRKTSFTHRNAFSLGFSLSL